MKRLKFTIRTLLLLAVVVAVGIVIYQRQIQIREVVRRFESFGGKVEYQKGTLDWFHLRTDHFFANAVTVDLSRSRAGRGDLVGIEHLSHLEKLYLNRTSIGYQDVAELAKCERLKRLALWGNSNIGSKSIDELVKLPNLEVLDIHQTRIMPVDIGKLGSLPKLERLVFSPDFHSQEENCMNGEVMRQLSTIRHLQPTGDCFLWEFDAEEVQMFCASDTSRVTGLIFRDSEFDDDACRALNTVKTRDLDIQSCDIDDRRLMLIDHSQFGRIDIFNRREQEIPDITLEGLTRWIPPGLDEVGLHDDRVEFEHAPRFNWTFRLSINTPPLNQALLKQWIDLGMTEIQLSADKNLAGRLGCIRFGEPADRIDAT